MKPILYGKYSDSQSEKDIESGTIVLNNNANAIQHSSQWHANGNVRTWKLQGTLAELRTKAKAIASTVDELGTLGGSSVITLTFRRLKGYATAQVVDGKAQGSFNLNTDYQPSYTRPRQVFMLALTTEHIQTANLYNTDGEATAELNNFRYTFSNDAVEMPDYFAVYGSTADTKKLTYLGYLERDFNTLDNTAFYNSVQPIDLTEYTAAYLVPSNTNIELPESLDITKWGYGAHSQEDILKLFPTYQQCYIPVAYSGREYGYNDNPTYILEGYYMGTITPDADNGESTFNFNTTYNTYSTDARAPLYEGTVQRTYYSKDNTING